MNKEELMDRINEMTDEQKADFTAWLKRGDGHSVAPMEYFTSMGIPEEFLAPMVNRTWSNFVQIPKGIVKIASDCITDRPIGYYDGESYGKGWNRKGWKFLLTPVEQEVGFLEGDSYNGIAGSRTQKLWLEETEEHEFDESDWDEVVKEHNLNPNADYWGHRWEETDDYEKGITVVEYKLPVGPTLDNYSNDPLEHEIEQNRGHYLVKYDGTKRVEYISVNKVAWHNVKASEKPLTKKAAMDWVREKLNDGDDKRSVLFVGDVNFQKDGKMRPMKDIAQDKWQESQDELAYHQKSIERETERCPDILGFIKNTDNVPVGWIHEQLEPLGYSDVMWNGGFMTPWVDGISSTGVISSIKGTLGIEGETGMIGRGSHARKLGEFVLTHLEEQGALAC